ncbi:MAG: hypothetical protein AB1473_06885 [Thermodesulfobacteriota bacterium]
MMKEARNNSFYLICALVAAAFVYSAGNWQGFANPYLINDDVRQQIFWMQEWMEPGLFQDDLLTEYARDYVPWGVRAVYRIGSLFMNPVRFTNVLTGILYVLSAGLLFGLCLSLRDRLTALLVVCMFFILTGLLAKMAGGLSRSFVVPLLFAYLFFLSRGDIQWAALTLMIQPLFNPYVFLLCLTTHAVFLSWNFWMELARRLLGLGKTHPVPVSPDADTISLSRLLLWNAPILLAFAFMLFKHVFSSSSAFGHLVTRAEMAGKVEYTAAGRYEFLPDPSFLYELIRPWIFSLPFREWGIAAGWIGAALLIVLAVYAVRNWKPVVDLSGLKIFGYLFAASLLLYVAARIFLAQLFVPRRYIEYSLLLFYCMVAGVFLRVAIESLGLRRFAFPFLVTVLVLFGAVRSHNMELYDFSRHADLYQFLRTTPKTALIAGHPELMDNIPTFARRKAFVNYELSHTWIEPFWSTIKKRTYDFFRAYYAQDPEEIRRFCREYGIDYLLVRDEDFSAERLQREPIYFEPFNTFVRELTRSASRFAILDAREFPPLYEKDGIRVITPGRGPANP